MAQAGYTPISIYYSTTAAATPAAGNLVFGELAINITDGKLFYEDNLNAVQVIATKDAAAGIFTTVDATNIEVTNIKAKDGTASASIADSTGVFTHATTTVFPAGAVGTPSITTTGDTNTGIFFPAADTIAFAEGGAEAMRIDSSGNVGIGVTPSAWDAGWKVLQISEGVLVNSDSQPSLTDVGSNFYVSGGADKYIVTDEASKYRQYNGEHIWFTAPSGTAGNNITFTERMRIDSSGNVGIGTTSTSSIRLHVDGAGTANVLTLNSTTNTYLQFRRSGSNVGYIQTGSTGLFLVNEENQPLVLGTNNTERMRITSSGNVGIGTTNPGFKLDITDATTSQDSGGIRLTLGSEARSHLITNTTPNASSGRDLGVLAWRDLLLKAGQGTTEGVIRVNSYEYTTFGTGSSYTERMRIDSSGNVGIGTSSPGARLHIYNSGTTVGQLIETANAASSSFLQVKHPSNYTEIVNRGDISQSLVDVSAWTLGIRTLAAQPIYFATNGTERMRIDSSGNVGIGVTPADSFAFGRAVDVGSTSGSFYYCRDTDATNGVGGIGYSGTDLYISNKAAGNIRFFCNTDATERARITSAGNFNIKGDFLLDSSGPQIKWTSDALRFYSEAAATERARITTAGDFLVGTTTVYTLSSATITTGQFGATNNGGINTANMQCWNQATSGDNLFITFYTEGGGGNLRGYIDYNRGSGVTRYSTTSDATLKNIIGDSDGQKSVEILNSTRIREFAWKDDPTQKPHIGVIAQELYETYPGAVAVGGDFEREREVTEEVEEEYTDEEGNTQTRTVTKVVGTEKFTQYRPWSVDKTAFQLHLVAGWQAHEKLLKEAMTRIEALEAEVAALKGN